MNRRVKNCLGYLGGGIGLLSVGVICVMVYENITERDWDLRVPNEPRHSDLGIGPEGVTFSIRNSEAIGPLEVEVDHSPLILGCGYTQLKASQNEELVVRAINFHCGGPESK